jgi:hypothetical protein
MFQLRKPYALLLIILTVLTVYYSAIFAEILSIDDKEMIERLINLDGFDLKRHFFPGGGYYYRPLLSFTFIADKYFWGAHESFMHLENVIIHALNAVLVYLLTTRIIEMRLSKSGLVPLVAALLFALHPLATEPVNWISGRTDLLACFFVLSSFYFLLKALKSSANTALVISAILFFLSPLAKESGIFWYPAAMLLVYVMTRNKELSFSKDLFQSIRKNYRYYLALTATPVGYFTLRYFALKTYDSSVARAVKGVVNSQHHDIYNKIRISFKVFGFYIKKLIFPLPLNFTISNVSNWYVLVGVIGIIICLYLCYKRDVISALLLMSACTIAPALLVPLGRMALAPIAERYLYIPTAFFSIAVVLYGAKLFQKANYTSVVSSILPAILLSVCGFVTLQRNFVWQKNLSLFQDSVAQNPDHAVMRNELANALRNEGRHTEADSIYNDNKTPLNEEISLAAEINRALTFYRNDDLKSAIALLKRFSGHKESPYYRDYLQKRIYFNDRLIERLDNPVARETIQRENLSFMIELQHLTGDPHGFYNIGQLAMNLGDLQAAYDYFRLAADNSASGAYYKEPAKKLAESIRRQLERK